MRNNPLKLKIFTRDFLRCFKLVTSDKGLLIEQGNPWKNSTNTNRMSLDDF